MKRIAAWLVGAVVFGVPATSLALDLGQVRINGFVTQGYLNSSGNNFLAESLGGTTQLNEIGLTFNTQVSDRLRVGAQLLSRDMGPEGNNKVLLDWGFGDYRYQDWLGVRAGKIKIPIGLYNEGRDSDFLRPMALLPQSLYDENKRTLLAAAGGGGLYGNLGLGLLGDLDYQLVYGEVNFQDDSQILRGLQGAATEFTQKRFAASGNPAFDFQVSKLDANNEYVYCGSLVYNAPLDGLRLGFSLFEGETKFTAYKSTGGTDELRARMKEMLVYSLEYAHPLVTFSSEYTLYRHRKEFFGTAIPSGTSEGWYGMLSVRPWEPLTLSVLYDLFYEDKDDRDGDNLVAQGKPDYFSWRKDLGIGVRYDVTLNWMFKAEWHHVEGAALGLPVFNGGSADEDWEYFVVKASFNF